MLSDSHFNSIYTLITCDTEIIWIIMFVYTRHVLGDEVSNLGIGGATSPDSYTKGHEINRPPATKLETGSCYMKSCFHHVVETDVAAKPKL